jgi:hypothetical protein
VIGVVGRLEMRPNWKAEKLKIRRRAADDNKMIDTPCSRLLTFLRISNTS